MQTNFQKELEVLSEKMKSKFNKQHKTSIPDILYHYTTAYGLTKILKTKKIYLTEANYLNDSSELNHGWNITEKIITTFKEEYKENNKTIYNFLNHLLEAGNPIKSNLEVFIASFCEEDDLLNQWRGYGSSDGAFSIGIKTTGTKTKRDLSRVEYNEGKQKKNIKRLIQPLLDLMGKHHNSMNDEDLRQSLIYFCQYISCLLVSYKDNAFETEKEWRLDNVFFKNKKGKYSELEFRERSGMIVPFLKAPLCNTDSNDSKIPLVSITYALSKNNSLTEKSIKLLLLKHGYDLEEIEIKASKVPLRFK